MALSCCSHSHSKLPAYAIQARYGNYLLYNQLQNLMDCSEAGYVLRVELKSFSNPHHTLANGTCCEEQLSSSKTCTGACDVAFVFCWKNYNSGSTSIAPSACMSRGSTTVYEDGDSIDFLDVGIRPSNAAVPLSNPIEMRGDVWPVSP